MVSLVVIAFCGIAIGTDAFQQCMNHSYYESSDHEPEKGIAQILRTLGWSKTCAGEFFSVDGEAITAFFTLVLGISTVALWGVTRTVALAAKESADAALATERARFFIVIDTTDLTYMTSGVILWIQNNARAQNPVPMDVAIKFRFKNYGKTPGIIKELSVGAAIAADPVKPHFVLANEEFQEIMVGAEPTEQKWHQLDPAPTILQAQAIRNNTLRVWFFGRLYYDDVFGNHQVHKFYFRSVQTEGKCILRPYDFEDHNKST